MKRLLTILGTIIVLLAAVPIVAQGKVSGVVIVNVTATDAGCGIKQVQLFLGSTPLGPALTTAPYTYSWNTTTSPDAIYDLKATAQDKSGGPTPLPGQECNGSQPNSATATKSIEVDNTPADTTPPTVNIVTPVAGSTVSGKIDVKVAAVDPSGVQQIQLFINGQIKSSVGSADTLTYNWNTNPYKGGIVTLKALAFDDIGNGPGQAQVSVTVPQN